MSQCLQFLSVSKSLDFVLTHGELNGYNIAGLKRRSLIRVLVVTDIVLFRLFPFLIPSTSEYIIVIYLQSTCNSIIRNSTISMHCTVYDADHSSLLQPLVDFAEHLEHSVQSRVIILKNRIPYAVRSPSRFRSILGKITGTVFIQSGAQRILQIGQIRRMPGTLTVRGDKKI